MAGTFVPPIGRGAPAWAWPTVALLVLLGAIAFLDRQILSLLVGPIKADLGLSDVRISLLQGLAFAILYSTCALPIGQAVDRYQRRPIIFLGVLIWGAAASASGLAHGFAGLLTARVFVGMGEAALAPAAYSMVGDLFARRRLSLVLSIYSMGSALGAAVALVAGSLAIGWVGNGLVLPLVGALRPWQSVMVLTGLPGVALCWLIFLVPEPARQARDGASAAPDVPDWRELGRFVWARRRFFACHLAGFGCMIAAAYGGLSWLPSVLIRGFGQSIQRVGLILGAVGLVTSVIGLLFNGFVVDRLFAGGRPDAHLRYYAVAAPVIALLSLAATAAGGLVAYLAAMALPLMLLNFAGVAAAAVQLVTPPALRGRISALYLLVISLFGLIVGPFVVALISDDIVGAAQVKLALGLSLALFCTAAALCFAAGLKPMRVAIRQFDG